jgi:glucose/arabinose dehydrogenase
MRARAEGALLALLLCACGPGDRQTGGDTQQPSDSLRALAQLARRSQPAPVDVADSLLQLDTLARGLEVPWSAVVLDSGDLIVTEREGRVNRIPGDGSGHRRVLGVIPVRRYDADWKPESGLMGIAAPPEFAGTGFMFVHMTADVKGWGLPGQLTRRVANRARGIVRAQTFEQENMVLRLRVTGDTAYADSVLLRGIPANHYHAGGFIEFGPDGFLYAGAGDATNPRVSQDTRQKAGKVLRFGTNGRAATDNPTPSSTVFASGVRNPQGLAWHAQSGAAFMIDHGPTGLPPEGARAGNDELNVLVAGANYGWPDVDGYSFDSRFVSPIHVWEEAIAPSGIASLPTGDSTRALLLVSALRGQSLRLLELEGVLGRWTVTSERVLLRGTHGRLRLLAADESGAVYVGTSNRDGRGAPRPGDDMVLRIRIPGSLLLRDR